MPLHILLLEDDDGLRRLYTRTLEREGFVLTEAADIQTAEARIAEGRFDLLICDIQLTDGLATAFMEAAHGAGTPILAISSDERYRGFCEAQGFGFLRKPVSMSLLAPMVMEILNGAAPAV